MDRLNRQIRLFDRGALVCSVVAFALVCLLLHRTARAQDNYVPCYEASVGVALLNDPAVAKSKLILGINPNSGPHNVRLADSGQVIDKARTGKVRCTFYIDAMTGPNYSPLIIATRQGLKLEQLKTARVKTKEELRAERNAYIGLYGGEPWGWFIDDVRPGMNDVLNELATWRGQIILNPGTHYQPPAWLPRCWVVIHEDERQWKPSTLTPWEKANLSRCIVMQLNLSADSLPAFTTSTAGVAARYASPLSDRAGAYNHKPFLLP